jgi:hypothetical protein
VTWPTASLEPPLFALDGATPAQRQHNSREPMTDKPDGKRKTWKRFAWILGAFACLLVVSIVTSPHNSEHPLAAHPALDPVVWVFAAGVAWVIARLLDTFVDRQ